MFDNSGHGRGSQLPPVTKHLLIINIAIWLIEWINPAGFGDTLINRLGLHFFEGSLFNPAQLFTYMFLHEPSSIIHILFNMFTLWMFGRLLEQVWGSRRFLTFYLVCGVGAALVQEAVWPFTWMDECVSYFASRNGLSVAQMKSVMDQALAAGNPESMHAVAWFKSQILITVGASGAIFGVLLGFAFVFPNLPLYLFFIPVPVKAKYMVAGYAVLEFFFGITGTLSTVAHFAHLGGMLFGLPMLLYWKKRGTLRGKFF
ncbi:MAG: rhomboid family intramembrane serine protease [Muribaculaceae bacterium]|nr:rhomboid family intramembrane serine protease [Muribaculaceae bacterium]